MNINENLRYCRVCAGLVDARLMDEFCPVCHYPWNALGNAGRLRVGVQVEHHSDHQLAIDPVRRGGVL